MGGFGSGRPARYPTIESARRIDIRALRRHGWMRPGIQGKWEWQPDSLTDGFTMGYRVSDESSIVLDYTVWDDDDQERHTHVVIRTQTRPCRYGGTRSYFLCPNCRRTCEVVVMTTNAHHWGCRKCFRLRYCSQRLAPGDRLQRRSDRLYERAGIEDENGRITKHKWMRWRTFNRLFDRAEGCARASDAEAILRLGRLGYAGVDEFLAELSRPKPG
jgi:hypothetical protein